MVAVRGGTSLNLLGSTLNLPRGFGEPLFDWVTQCSKDLGSRWVYYMLSFMATAAYRIGWKIEDVRVSGSPLALGSLL